MACLHLGDNYKPTNNPQLSKMNIIHSLTLCIGSLVFPSFSNTQNTCGKKNILFLKIKSNNEKHKDRKVVERNKKLAAIFSHVL